MRAAIWLFALLLAVATRIGSHFLDSNVGSHFASRAGTESNQRVLDNILPKNIGDWKRSDAPPVAIVDPTQQAAIEKIYTEVDNAYYSRVGSDGIQTLMISIAYGANQNKSNQVHRPEICYPAQGFKIEKTTHGQIELGKTDIPVTKLIATSRGRREQISYFIRVGDAVSSGWLGQKVAGAAARLKFQRPDGLLFRISSINLEDSNAFAIQEAFIADLFKSSPPADRIVLFGADVAEAYSNE